MTTAIYCLLFTFVFIWAYREWRRRESIPASSAYKLRKLIIYLGIGLLVRVIVACTVYGYEIDVNTFKAWAGHAASAGPGQFYTAELFVDYPPGYVYVLYVLGKLRSLLSLPYDSALFLLIIKSPAILADLAVACLLFRWAEQRSGPRAAAAIAMFYLLNPAIAVNSAGWGQVDSFFMLWLLLCFEAIQRGAMHRASALYAVALLVKPQALLLAPLLLVVWIRRGSWRTAALSLVTGTVTFVALALPFTIHKSPFWLAGLYFGTLASYPYASLNAFNLMSFLGGNFVPLNDKVLFLTYQTWSVLFMTLVLGGTVYSYFRSRKDESQLMLIAGLLMTGAFLVLTKMHERYLFYSLPLLLAGFAHLRDRRLWFIVFGFSVTHFINVNQVLLDSMRQQYFIPKQDLILLLISAANLILFGYLVKVVWRLVVKGELREISSGEGILSSLKAVMKGGIARFQLSAAMEKNVSSAHLKLNGHPELPKLTEEKPLHWKRKDTLLLGGLVLMYAALAFWNLGSLQAPETGWQATQSGEKVVFNLGTVKPIERINSFSGIGDGSFTYEMSEDGKAWTDPIPVTNDVFKVFMWQVAPVNVSGQYIRLTVVKPPFTLNEIAIYEQGSEKPVAIQSVSGDSINPATQADLGLLCDEPDKAAYRATYLNGAYFDEIYHARTAYEHLHQLEPYESTHPPLGKILISAGIALFGMNPFGWRVVGTLFGIAMLPVMYLFGKRLFGRSEYAFAASFLMACDGLHFVQTRIATIDVYGVFFIMLMFYFMHRFTSTSLFSPAWKKTLLPLGLSGLCFGLGAASKWIVLYGGGGLAVLYFLWLYVQFRKYRQSGPVLVMKHKPDKQLLAEWQHIRTVFPRRAAVTTAWCAVYFIIVPAIIYVLSYIPFMRVPGPGHGLADVLSYQKHMFSYHSQLIATHPFSSSWWQWPVMSRPVWYYGQAELSPGTISSIVAIGNPLVWWSGFAAILWVTYRAIRTGEKVPAFLAIAFFSQYLPWMLVPRLTFIYHYFAMVPFSILAIVYYYKRWKEAEMVNPRWLYVYLLAAAFCFTLFYPVLSGLVIPRGYAEHVLKWFPQWQFF